MRQPATRALHDYWSRLKGDRPAPDSSDVDLDRIRRALPDAFVVESEPLYFCPRGLCGERMNAFWPVNETDRSFLGLWTDADREDVKAIVEAVMEDATPAVGAARGIVAHGAETLDFELLMLPLRRIDGTRARILGALAVADRPQWLGKKPLEPLILVALRLLSEKRALSRPIARDAFARRRTFTVCRVHSGADPTPVRSE
jgi:hypothetical protein